MAQNFYTVNICTETVLQAIKWLDLALKDNEPYHMEVVKNAIENDPNFQWKDVDKKLRSKYNYRYKKAKSIFKQ